MYRIACIACCLMVCGMYAGNDDNQNTTPREPSSYEYVKNCISQSMIKSGEATIITGSNPVFVSLAAISGCHNGMSEVQKRFEKDQLRHEIKKEIENNKK